MPQKKSAAALWDDRRLDVSTGKRDLALLHLDHVLHLTDHTANFRAILKLADPMHLVEAEPDQRSELILGTADGRTRLLDLDRRHCLYSTTAAASASADC